MKTVKKILLGCALPVAALILEILPYGAVCIFANGPGESRIETFSYFSPIPYGYANFFPMITGILTAVLLILGAVFLITNKRALLKAEGWVAVAALITSLLPAVFGADYINGFSMVISAVLLAQCILGFITKAQAK